MPNTLTVNTDAEDSLGYHLWQFYHHMSILPTFEDYIKSLDENIIEGKWESIRIGEDDYYTITFNDEISKTFFLLKYS